MEPEKLFDDQNEIYQEMVPAILGCLPNEWDEVKLTLEPKGDRVVHKLENPKLKGKAKKAEASKDLVEQSSRLRKLFEENDLFWSRANIHMSWDNMIDDWRFDVSFDYPKGQ
jgi:hypothetical protein